jgi:hypothetical protein
MVHLAVDAGGTGLGEWRIGEQRGVVARAIGAVSEPDGLCERGERDGEPTAQAGGDVSQRGCASGHSDTDADAECDADVDACVVVHADSDSDGYEDTDSEPYADSHSDVDTHAIADEHPDEDGNAICDADRDRDEGGAEPNPDSSHGHD